MISIHNCRYCYLYGRVVYNLRYHQVVSPRSSHSTDYVDTASGEIVAVPFRIIILHSSRFYITQTSFTVTGSHRRWCFMFRCTSPCGLRANVNLVVYVFPITLRFLCRDRCTYTFEQLVPSYESVWKLRKPPSSNFIRQRRSKSRRYLDGRMGSRHLSQQSTFLFR